jgi:O-methyltransferase involved in polyketide biosynthesis
VIRDSYSQNELEQMRDKYASLLLPLYIRAIETERPDALLKDDVAVSLVEKLHLDEAFFRQAQVDQETQVFILLRNRQFDLLACNFLNAHLNGIVVYLGCGLDARFERVDNGQVEWYDLDLPEVIRIRQQLLGIDDCRYHLLSCSALDYSWMKSVNPGEGNANLFLAEGLFMFFTEEQVKGLVLELLQRFPGSELIFDAFSPFYVWGNNRRLQRTKVGARANWALKHAREPENWSENIHLVDEWYPFLQPEPRLANIRWVKYIPLLSKTTGIFRYMLGR